MSTEERSKKTAKEAEQLNELLNEFEKDFPTEQDCLEELLRIAGIRNKECRFCGHNEVEKRHGGRAGMCRSCKKLNWFTAGTCLHHIKKAKARLAAIYFADRGEYMSSSKFSKILQISQSSAFEILKWLSLVIAKLIPDNGPSIHSSKFIPVFCKRSKETPAGAHPISEQQRAEEEEEKGRAHHHQSHSEDKETGIFGTFSPEITETINLDCSSMSETAGTVMKMLSESSLCFDELFKKLNCSIAELSSTLTLLELDRAVTRTAGDRYLLSKKEVRTQSGAANENIVISLFLDFVKTIFQGISRKYLKSYLALYWCRSVTHLRLKGDFFESCLRGAPAFSDRKHMTPLVVRLSISWKHQLEHQLEH